MSKRKVRSSKTCQNCGHFVLQRFCPSCGQENIETRVHFGHLLHHFLEDLTHYEHTVWRTIKHLLFYPGYLTNTYLSGKRHSYVAPIKLYIFISFIAFLIPSLIPQYSDAPKIAGSKLLAAAENIPQGKDTLIHLSPAEMRDSKAKPADSLVHIVQPFKTVQEYDSTANGSKKDNFITRFVTRKTIELNRFSRREIKLKMAENFSHNFPKAIFIFLPLFALILWIFHDKKKWFYFDHAIFTLHYFSFILLLFTILDTLPDAIPWDSFISSGLVTFTSGLITWLFGVYYFYRAHRKVYAEKKITTFIKSTVIFFINSVLFLLILLAFVAVTFANLH